VVHPSNPLDSLSRGSLPRLLGRRGTWGEAVPGGVARPVEVVATGRNTGLYEVAAQVAGEAELALSHLAETQDSVLAYVARRPGALGLVSLEALRDTVLSRRVKVLAVRDSASAFRPSQWTVYDREYPLRYEAYYVTTRPQRAIEARFATFVMSDVGQRAIQRVGLVPAKIPAYRFIITQ
jgi:ABC-type phosphate transport system substrate-binding protein